MNLTFDGVPDLQKIVQSEWLETNGLGGFASSTLAGINTRRYHGLLTASLRPPVERYVLLSKLEEVLILGDQRFDLSANFYPGVTHPQGYLHLTEFRSEPYPVFTYRIGDVRLEKHVVMPHGENTVVIQWIAKTHGCRLEVRPMIAFRDYHSLTHANDAINPSVDDGDGMLSVRPYRDLPRLYFGHNCDRHGAVADWYQNFEYPIERERGLDYREDLFCPMMLAYNLQPGQPAVLIASTEQRPASAAGKLRKQEERRRSRLLGHFPTRDPFARTLARAVDQYIVDRGTLKTLIAGYPWFSDWGRDTMIALPGLTLVTGRFDVARSILLAFAEHVSEGMLPNRFPDGGEQPEYNTVDATLWFFNAILAYADYTGDLALVRDRLYPVLIDIVKWHVAGTRFGIKVDDDGLLRAGVPGVQLTWMDAKVGDWVVTPRIGKPVEIQALWFNALRILAEFASRFGDAGVSQWASTLAEKASASFNAQFWSESQASFYDVIDGEHRDDAIRPNQVIALSLPYTMVTPERARAALATVERESITPKGLRTLARNAPEYRGTYSGSPWERDAVYHQGTVWPWLLGPFVTAYVRAHGKTEDARSRAGEFLAGLRSELDSGCIGQIAEIFDGDAPHAERGCCAQAWSVGEVLRALVEDVHGVRPQANSAIMSA